jgi:hypothetical protein
MGLFKMLFPKMDKEFEEIDRKVKKAEVERKKDQKELKELNESLKETRKKSWLRIVRRRPDQAFEYRSDEHGNRQLVEIYDNRISDLVSKEEFEDLRNKAIKIMNEEEQSNIKSQKKEIKEREKKCRKIISFLKKEKTKLPASDIDFQLKIGDVNLVKKLCEEMYRDKKIGRTGNYRYFV